MAFSRQTGLAYIPVTEMGAIYNDRGITRENWKRAPGMVANFAVNVDLVPKELGGGSSALLAWDPRTTMTSADRRQAA